MTTSTLVELPVDCLYVDPLNPREHVDQENVLDLARSVADHGVDQPLQVRPDGHGQYGVLSGQQRLAAARIAGLGTVPCLVLDVDDDTAAVIAMAGNTGSRPMRPSDEARGYQRLVDRGMTQRAVAEACGVAQSRVSNLMKLLALDADLVAKVDAGKVGLQRAVASHRARYSTGHGTPRGTAARRARELGALGAVHLTVQATARLLGMPDARRVGQLIRHGHIERDPVTGGVPLHQVAGLLDRERDTADAGGTIRVSPAEAVRQALPGPVHARLEQLASSTGHPTSALAIAAVEDLLRRSHA